MERLSSAAAGESGRSRSQEVFSLPAAYFAGLALLYVRNFFSTTTFIDVPDAVDSLALALGLFFLAMHVLGNGHLPTRTLVVYVVIAALCVVVYLQAGETGPLVFWAIVVATSTLPNRNVALRLWLDVSAALAVVLVVMYGLVNLLAPDMLDLFYRNTEAGTTTRYAFFLAHPNMTGTLALCLCGAYCTLHFNELRFGHYVVGLALAVALYISTASRTSSYLLFALVVVAAIARSTGVFERPLSRLACGLLTLALLVGTHLIATVFYSDSVADLLTGRVSLWYAAAKNLGLTVLGQELVATPYVNTQGWTVYATTLDSLYAAILYVYGIAFGAVYCVLYWFACTRGGVQYLPFLLISMAYGVTEVQMLGGVFTSCLALVIGAVALEIPVEDVSARERLKGRWSTRKLRGQNMGASAQCAAGVSVQQGLD